MSFVCIACSRRTARRRNALGLRIQRRQYIHERGDFGCFIAVARMDRKTWPTDMEIEYVERFASRAGTRPARREARALLAAEAS